MGSRAGHIDQLDQYKKSVAHCQADTAQSTQSGVCVMDVLTLKKQIDENFSEFRFSTKPDIRFHFTYTFTLAESDFEDRCRKLFSDYSQADLYLKLKERYSDDVAKFITNNMVEGQYIEPFQHWSEIPLWYYSAFGYAGRIGLTGDNFVYYLVGFMNVMILNHVDIDSNSCPTGLWWLYEMLNSSEHVAKLLSEKLNHKQLETVELFLCYDPVTQTFDLSER